ncbi:hypothetical protein EB796_003299 [Bugula neritina]|uniref:Uncharacterized protein n=1 Tax=Bugula neritina TaxID=10212 RepID=A0A7J7KLG0_BUGNE|nr:hypothetical protein EB796_003299 [Bugula neritina]
MISAAQLNRKTSPIYNIKYNCNQNSDAMSFYTTSSNYCTLIILYYDIGCFQFIFHVLCPLFIILDTTKDGDFLPEIATSLCE